MTLPNVLLCFALVLTTFVRATPGRGAEQGSSMDLDKSYECLAQSFSPAALKFRLDAKQEQAARNNTLGLLLTPKDSKRSLVTVQWEFQGSEATATLLAAPMAALNHQFTLQATPTPFLQHMHARLDAASGQIDITEDDRPVLRYNYQAIEPGEITNKVTPANRIYARARSDYIHPLYGLHGEELTRDWPVDHPHHRGIYWAWPEVDYGKERGDLHALQKVFARPTGKVKLQSGPVFAQIAAENLWQWEDREPIVRETAIIRAYDSTAGGRIIDLAFQFVGLKEGVSIARRGTDKYGGLNVRMATPRAQHISVVTDPPSAQPRRSWSTLGGIFKGNTMTDLTVFQHSANPDYPGDWIQYPELSWCQPTFPAAGTRYVLQRDKPLVLRYRLWVHMVGSKVDVGINDLWDAFHAPAAAKPEFQPSAKQ